MKHITDYLEKDQVDTILEYARACSSRDYLMLWILWRTGIRVSELLSLRPQDLEPHNQVVNITKAKGNKQRRVMLDPETLDHLSEYILQQNIPDLSTCVYPLKRQVWNIVKKYAG
jgi:integrase/recombinase XerC